MNTVLLSLLAGLCLMQMPTAHGMDKPMPTITDADDETYFDTNTEPVTTVDTTTALSTVAQPSAQPNVTHIASIANNKGQVMHLGVNADSIAGSINKIGTDIAQGLQRTTPVVTNAMQKFTQQADQTLQVVGASVDMLGTHGAGAITKMGAAGSNAVGNMVNAVTSHVVIMGSGLGDVLNSVTDEGRATISEFSTAGQNLSNNVAKNAQDTVRVAGTQAVRVVAQARNVATVTLTGVDKVATTIGTQVNQLAATVATPANMKALGDSESAQAFSAHAGNSMNKLAGAACSVAGKTNQFLDNGTKALKAAQPVISNVAKITGDIAAQTPALLHNINSVLAAATRTLNPAIGDSTYPQQYLPAGNNNGPTIEEIVDTPLLALPSPEEFASLPSARKQTSQRQLLAAVKQIVDGTNVSISSEFANKARTATHKVTQQQILLSAEEYSSLLAATRKAQNPNATDNGQLMLEWKTDDTNNQNPAPTPTATPSELRTLRHELNNLPQASNTAEPRHAPGRSFTAALPKPVLVIGACVCITGLMIATKKLYNKWKKNKEKKEKREQQRQQVTAQQPEATNA